jgi:prephenate dehydrogenase
MISVVMYGGIEELKNLDKIILRDVDRELFQKAVVVAIKEGKTPQKWVEEAVAEWLAQGPVKLANIAVREKLEREERRVG